MKSIDIDKWYRSHCVNLWATTLTVTEPLYREGCGFLKADKALKYFVDGGIDIKGEEEVANEVILICLGVLDE